MNLIKRIRKNIIKLMKNTITKEQLLYEFNISENDILNAVVEMLEIGSKNKDNILIEDAIYLIFLYDLDLNKMIRILNNLIITDWHKQHENIAMLLQKAKDSSSIDSLYIAANMNLDYLSYDEHYALAVKCIWGLGEIGSKDAILKLKLLSSSNNNIIAENAVKQLAKRTS